MRGVSMRRVLVLRLFGLLWLLIGFYAVFFSVNTTTVTERVYPVNPSDLFMETDYNQLDSGQSSREDDNSPDSDDRISSTEDISYADAVGHPEGRANDSICSNRVRIRVLNELCQESPARNQTYNGDTRHPLHIVVLDHDRKLFYCLIGKAGSKSWMRYLINSKYANYNGSLQDVDFLKKVGLEMYKRMSLDQVEAQFGGYFRFLVVRHPLQRMASAYYETVVSLKKYRNSNGTLLNFTEFVQIVTGKMMDYDPHWRRYVNRCQVCRVNYQYVIKTETVDYDIKGFNRIAAIDEGLVVNVTHKNKFFKENETTATEAESSQHYKYDRMLYDLQRERPDLMEKLLKVYREDMHLFGYTWDWDRGRSGCRLQYTGQQCC